MSGLIGLSWESFSSRSCQHLSVKSRIAPIVIVGDSQKERGETSHREEMNVRDDKAALWKTLKWIWNYDFTINVKFAFICFGWISGRLSFIVVFYFPKGVVWKDDYRKNQCEDMRVLVVRRFACRYDKVIARSEGLRPPLVNFGIAIAGVRDFRRLSCLGCLNFHHAFSDERFRPIDRIIVPYGSNDAI